MIKPICPVCHAFNCPCAAAARAETTPMTDPGHIDWYPTDEERAAKRKADCAEAVAAERARIKAAVEEMPSTGCGRNGYLHGRRPHVNRAAVLAIIDGPSR